MIVAHIHRFDTADESHAAFVIAAERYGSMATDAAAYHTALPDGTRLVVVMTTDPTVALDIEGGECVEPSPDTDALLVMLYLRHRLNVAEGKGNGEVRHYPNGKRVGYDGRVLH